jgi:hypothetical protein
MAGPRRPASIPATLPSSKTAPSCLLLVLIAMMNERDIDHFGWMDHHGSTYRSIDRRHSEEKSNSNRSLNDDQQKTCESADWGL